MFLLKAGGKIVATFVATLALFVLCFMFWPKGVTMMQDFSNWAEDYLRSPGFLDDQAKALYNTFINSGTILGVTATVIARTLVEAIAWIGGSFTGRD